MAGSHRRHAREAREVPGPFGGSYQRAILSLSRRQLLNVAWKLGAAAVLQPLARVTASAQQPVALPAYPFTLGVASGEPWPESIVLWTRLAPDPFNGGGMPMVSMPVEWEIADDEHFTRLAQSGTVIARPELGHSVHVEVEGLKPGYEYWYRFHVGRETSPTGRTKTAPADAAPVDRLRFAVCGCSNFQSGYFTPLPHLAAERFDFVFHTGDYIYEGRGNTGRSTPRAHRGDEIYTLVDYRNRYAQYKADPNLMAAHASAPFIVTWDDHEVDNDYAGAVDERDTPPEVFLLRRAAAYQAYFESMPLRVASIPDGPSLRLYRRLRFGSLIDLSVLDTRQYRSDQACGHGSATNCEATSDESRSMLGVEQERWLLAQLADVRATWTVLGQQVPMWGQNDGPDTAGAPGAMDKWDGYPHSRHRLFSRLVEARTPNPIVLSGDVHVHYGADLKMDFRDPDSRVVGTELTNSSISSGGDGSEQADYWEQMKDQNPHLRFHSGRRGYIACTASPREMRADFMVVDRVSVAESPIRRAGSLVVEAGRVGAVTD